MRAIRCEAGEESAHMRATPRLSLEKLLYPTSNIYTWIILYRVTHLVANLGWVDYDLGCSTILLGQKVATVAATSQGNSPNLSQPNPGSPPDGSPCIFDNPALI